MSRNPVILALPPFFGFTRRVVLVAAGVYVLLLVLGAFVPVIHALLADRSCLHMGDAFTQPWQFVTYPFVSLDLISLLFALLAVWFFGADMEQERGSVWMRDFFFASTIGGGLLAVVLSHTIFLHTAELGLSGRVYGLWPVVMAMLVGYAALFPNRELRLYFVIPIKARLLAALLLVIYLLGTMVSGYELDAMVALCSSLCGYLYMRFAPRAGLRLAGSEWWYGLRNRRLRDKRRHAAKKFTVYMRKQGKDVNIDASGKYVSLDEERHDPNDRRWMN